jgi:hypothetical protein
MTNNNTPIFNKASSFSTLSQSIPGATNLFTNLQPSVSEIVGNNPTVYQNMQEGARALQLRASGQYSNKQIITPFMYQINVEGTLVTVDYLGKRIITDNEMPYRAISSLSATKIDIKIINDSRDLGDARKDKPTPQVAAARQIFDTGTSTITNSLGNRFTQYTSDIVSKGSQIFDNLQSGNINGLLQSDPAVSKYTQSIARLPGISVVTDALGQIPSSISRLPNLTSAISNPVGAVQGIVGNAVQGLNLQAALPSVDLGSLTDMFSTATDIFHNGPPTSLEGVIALEKQIKGIICNFQLPNITLPDWDTITSFKFPKPEDIIKQIKKSVEDEIANVINKLDIREQLKQLLEQFDPKKIYEAVIKELTTCDNSPNAEENAKSGQGGSGDSESSKLASVFAAASPTPSNSFKPSSTPPTPEARAAADRAVAMLAAPTSEPGFKSNLKPGDYKRVF